MTRPPSSKAESVESTEVSATRTVERASTPTETRDSMLATQSRLLQSENLATLGLLAAGIGHDLRTPLAAIRSNTQLALSTIQDLRGNPARVSPVAMTCLNALLELEQCNLEAIERLTEIVEGLKAFARPNDSSPQETSIPEIVEQVLALCAHEIMHVRTVCSFAADLPPVAARPTDVMRVLMNLVVNAGHAVGADGSIKLAAECMPDGYVLLTVADDGPGIPPEMRAELFSVGTTTKSGAGGSGLGLSIVKRIVDSNHGSIQVSSDKGTGTEFRVMLPRADRN